ncbi:MAG: diacylglycerol kinase family protein [bacterium]
MILAVFNCKGKVRFLPGIEKAIQDKFPGEKIEVLKPKTMSVLTDAVRDAKDNKYSMVIVGGGDGTISLASSILNYSEVPLMAIPLGTVNAFAKNFNIPKEPAAAVKYYDVNRMKKIDTGIVNGHFFLNFMSIGIDAFAVHLMNEKIKKSIGRFAYIISGIRGLLNNAFIHPFTIGQEEYFHCIVSNVKNYAGYDIFADADSQDGEMSYTLHDSKQILSTLVWAYELANGKVKEFNRLGLDNDLIIEHEKPLKIQIDGEPVVFDKLNTAKNKLVIKVQKQSLKIFY